MDFAVSFTDLSSEEGSSASELSAPSCGTAIQSKSLVHVQRRKINLSPPPSSVIVEHQNSDESSENNHHVNNHNDNDTDAEVEEPFIANGESSDEIMDTMNFILLNLTEDTNNDEVIISDTSASLDLQLEAKDVNIVSGLHDINDCSMNLMMEKLQMEIQ